jgi:hypothetical protein
MLKKAGRAVLLLAVILLACRLWPHEPLAAHRPSSTAL